MTYNNVDSLLNSGKSVDEIIHYDFKKENGNFKSVDHIELWLEYRNTGKGWDCDGSGKNSNVTCGLSRDIYKVLWGWDSEKDSPFKNTKQFDNMRMGPDTMNSFFKVLTDVIEIVNPEGKKEYFKTVGKTLGKKKMWWSKEDFEREGFLKLIENVRHNNEVGVLITEYAKLTHTIGNFVLVPNGFNQGRAFKTNDYWDLSLMLIEKGIKCKGNMPSELLLKYINTFFLWDYVDENYNIKPFFTSHSLQNKKPKTIQEAVILLQSITNAILRRGYFMVAILKVATNYSEQYNQILNELKNMEKASMEKAIDIIKASINEDSEILGILNEISIERRWPQLT